MPAWAALAPDQGANRPGMWGKALTGVNVLVYPGALVGELKFKGVTPEVGGQAQGRGSEEAYPKTRNRSLSNGTP